MVGNHINFLEIPLVLSELDNPMVTGMAKKESWNNPLFYFLFNQWGIIQVDRNQIDREAFRLSTEALSSGKIVAIAPEGTRSPAGELQEGKAGIVLVALKAGVPIVPVGIIGTRDVIPKMFTFQHPSITLKFGPAFSIPPLDHGHRDEQMKQSTDEVMCRIAALLPPEYWGLYKDHPRLKELLAKP